MRTDGAIGEVVPFARWHNVLGRSHSWVIIGHFQWVKLVIDKECSMYFLLTINNSV